MVCSNGWRDIADLLVNGFIVALNKGGLYRFTDTYTSLCLCGWTNILKRLIEGIVSPRCRQHMVNAALQFWATGSQFDTYQMLVDDFGTDIDKETLKNILSYVCIHDHFNPVINTDRHTFVNGIIDRFKDTITPSMYECALNSACEGGCESMLDRFASDLRDMVKPEFYLKVLKTNLKGYRWLDDHRPFGSYVQRFGDGLSDSVCQDIFDEILTACTKNGIQAPSMLVVDCLEAFGNRITFNPNYTRLERMTCPALGAVLRFCGDSIGADLVNRLAANMKSEPDVMKTLIECCRDKIDGLAIINRALEHLGYVIVDEKDRLPISWLPSRMPKAIECCKYILIQFFGDISCQHTVKLLGLPPDILYSTLGADDVRILIGTHMRDGGLDGAIAALDPYHEHTYYILTDYRDCRIKGATPDMLQ